MQNDEITKIFVVIDIMLAAFEVAQGFRQAFVQEDHLTEIALDFFRHGALEVALAWFPDNGIIDNHLFTPCLLFVRTKA